jgi:hypothetical protein
MALSIIQEVSNEDPDFATTGTTIAVTLTVTAGSVLYVFVCHDSTGTAGTIACADNVNGTYGAALDDVNDATNAQRAAHFSFANSASGSITVTATLGTTHLAKGIWVVEIGGAKGISPLDGHAGQHQTSPGTGANAVSTGTISNTIQPAMLVAFGLVEDLTNGAPTAGTGFTSTKTAFAFGGVALCRSENKTLSTTGAQAGTFTTVSTNDTLVFGAIFDIAGPTITAQPTNQIVLLGQTATFNISATGTGTVHYQWRKNGSNVGTDSSSYTTPATDMTYNGAIYDCLVTDNNGTVPSGTASLTVYIVAAVTWFRA